MALYTSDAQSILRPDQVSDLLVEPVIATAVAAADGFTTTVTRLDSGTWRAPKVTADPSAQWVNEGQEIPVSDADLDEVEVIPRKIAGLTIVSSELIEDTDETAATVIGDGLTRDIARKIDAAFVSNLALPAPAGLAGIDYTEVAAGSLSNLDAFAQAVSVAEELGAFLTAWVTGPATALELATLKVREDSQETLLGTDPALPARRIIEGRPLLVTPGVPAGEVWGIPADRVHTLVRTDAEVIADGSAFFTSDRVAIRAKLRLGFGFVHEPAVVHLTFTAAP